MAPIRLRRRLRGGAPPIRPLNRRDFRAIAKRYPYYRTRRRYISGACALAGDLIDTRGLSSALELGPYLRTVIIGADVMDLRRQSKLVSSGQFVIHDATSVPWPIADKSYDLFVALQVFEHLGDSQPDAFREVCRIARNAIISLPIDWDMEDPSNCHHQISHDRALSWFSPVVPTQVHVGNGGPQKRLVYVFENLPG